ncbi:MAG: hypothetical protein RIS43_159 [Actinomycetota bacterium]|jgi:hypothetical protein
MTELPAAGWYQDPANADNVRYWDGQAWTEQVAPRASEAKVSPKPAVAQRSSREMFGAIAFGIGFATIALVAIIALFSA